MAKLLERQISNGADTSTWFDPWARGQSLIELQDWGNFSAFGGRDIIVDNLISNGEWDLSKLNKVGTHANTIKYIPLYTGRDHDT